MSQLARATTLAPFHFRALRFQWPADLATSCAFEMETLILSWYILIETKSVLLLSVYASLQYLGTLISPMLGVHGDHIGPRYLLSGMRAVYSTLGLTLLAIISLGAISPVYVFIVSAMMGLVRPSDMGMRVMQVGHIVPATHFVGAIGIQRTTMDSARIAGALAGAGIVAALGMTAAYVVIAGLYTTSCILTLQAKRDRGVPRPAEATTPKAPTSPWRELKEGARYVWTRPLLFATMSLAFIINLTAFPLMMGLMAYVAKEIYGTGQGGLSYMISAAGAGALLGSLIVSRYGSVLRPARIMVGACTLWYVFLAVFAYSSHLTAGLPFLFLVGLCSSMSQVPMQAMLLRQTDEKFRGRVMGIRMLMIYGNMLGLLTAGPLIAAVGYRPTATAYCMIGLVFSIFTALYWKPYVWRRDAPANSR